MRKDIVSSLKNSKMLFVRKLLGSNPVAVYKWSLLQHMICAIALFKKAGEARRNGKLSCIDRCKRATLSHVTLPVYFLHLLTIAFMPAKRTYIHI